MEVYYDGSAVFGGFYRLKRFPVLTEDNLFIIYLSVLFTQMLISGRSQMDVISSVSSLII